MSATSANNGGTSDATQTGSTKTFITALVLGLIIFGAEMLVFVLFHAKQKKVFQPRTYLTPAEKRPKELPKNPFKWFSTIAKINSIDVLHTNGLDAYAFVRCLSMYLKLFTVFWLVTWAILMPLSAAGTTMRQTGLSQFTFGNVATTQQSRYWGYIIVVYGLTAFVFYLIWTECANFVKIRHEYLSSPEWAASDRARTVLITGVKKDMMNEAAVRELAGSRSGAVDRVWLVRDVKDANDVFDDRAEACNKLEAAEGKALKLAAKRVRKGEAVAPSINQNEVEKADAGIMNSIITAKKRPTQRLGKIPFIGKKVDAIDYNIDQIDQTNKKLDELRTGHDQFEISTSAIVRFHSMADALDFTQNIDKAHKKLVAHRFPDVSPENIYWKNLGMNAKLLPGRKAISWSLTIGLILIWAIPVAFVGGLSNLSSLCSSVSFLSWLCKLPSPVVGIIQGAAPPVGLAILFMLLPIILRRFSIIEGIPLKTNIDLAVESKYWLFLVIHGFLVVTVASSLASALPGAIKNPSQAPTILASQLPLSSIFFLTYLITTGLSNCGKFLSQAVSIVVYKIKSILGGSTPRKIFDLEYKLPSVTYYQLMPNVDLLVILALVYSVIQPIICLLAVVAMGLYWLSFKYLFIYVYDQPSTEETGGLYFPRAIGHVFCGLYIEELCLIGLFFLASNAEGKRSSIGEAVLAIVLLIVTILFQLYLKRVMSMKSLELQKLGEHSHKSAAAITDENDNLSRTPTLTPDTQLVGRTSENMFDPPALWQPHQIIWLPTDQMGLARIEVAKIRAAGLEATCNGAEMDSKGKITVQTAAPDDPRGQYLNEMIKSIK